MAKIGGGKTWCYGRSGWKDSVKEKKRDLVELETNRFVMGQGPREIGDMNKMNWG